jgi:DNA-binding PadR family transcriptional regulator
LEEQRFLSSKREVAGGRSRIVYRTTKQGQRRLADARSNWQEIVAAISTVLQGCDHGKPALA